jgi:diguanylate cyclase (GGDEF)-like protein
LSLAPLSHPRLVALGLILLCLTYWAVLFIVSLPWLHPPETVIPALVLGSLPMFALTGVILWRQRGYLSAGLAYQDDLTALGNRRAFRGLTEEHLRGARSGTVTMILIDVDQLKLVNDECGHQAGDELLSLLARRLQKITPNPELVFRFGGDEFAILVDRSDGQAAAAIISKLEPFDTEFTSCGHEHKVNISYGYVSNLQGDTFEKLFSRADERLREFKRQLYNFGQAGERRMPFHPDGLADSFTSNIASLEDRRAMNRRKLTP